MLLAPIKHVLRVFFLTASNIRASLGILILNVI